ncbi:MAG: UvrD-helicase domain-containing protein [Oscillospiraceae bacterium]|nr:UvrD-helicase domain-containing protein [Oscillospiraceae bacterium]
MDNEQFKTEYVSARRAWLEHRFSGLNPMQRQAVLATEGPVLILAGAGSGKTTVLIQRIANLLRFGAASDSEQLPPDADEKGLEALRSLSPEAEPYAVLDPVRPWRILAITFTNKAAQELKLRLEKLLNEGADDIWACTFHSACLRILRKEAELLGYESGFSIYDTADSLSLMKQILKDRNLDEKVYQPRSVLSEISRAKDARVLPEEYEKNARAGGSLRSMRVAELYGEYTRRLFAANAMDFDDLILNTVLLLERYEDRRLYWQQRFSYIMVDEYQDTNHLQYLLISLLAGGHGNLCVVGDDDQSIYRFRGATIENILSFEQQFPGCRSIRLEQNYRSTEQILDAANKVIRHNTGRKGKELWTSLGSGEDVRVCRLYDENEEASAVASDILADYSRGMHWQDHAILYRMNAQSSQFEFAFKRNGIPYRVIGGARFFDRAEIKDMLSYLSIIQDPKDELRLMRILNVPPRGIGAKSVEAARSLALQEGKPLFEILEKAENYPELSRPALRMREFAGMIRDLQETKLGCAELYDLVLEKSGYLRMLEESKDPKDQSRIENVRELKTSMLGFENETGDSSLQAYLENIALYTDLDDMDRSEDSVVLMTIHSAKGLEFPVVYVVGMEEGIFPGIRAIGEADEMEEERRLCYVAFTRAKKKLVLTHARQRMLFGRTTANRVSRFLEESELVSGREESERRSAVRSADWEDFPGETRGDPWRKASVQPASGRKSEGRSSFPLRRKPETSSGDASAPILQLRVGQAVTHKAFGKGTVTKMTPMGGDHLIEIQFESVGSKKLMLKTASRFLQPAE